MGGHSWVALCILEFVARTLAGLVVLPLCMHALQASGSFDVVSSTERSIGAEQEAAAGMLAYGHMS